MDHLSGSHIIPKASLQTMTQRNRYVSYAVWGGKQAASRLDRTNMAVLIAEGIFHQFVTTDS